MDASDLKGKKGFTRIVNAFGYSLNGFTIAWKHEAAFRQECFLAAVLFPLTFLLDITALEQLALIAVLALVLIVELLNTAIENAIDRIGSERHTLSGHAKDLGSAAVFVALALTVCVWSIILWDLYCRS